MQTYPLFIRGSDLENKIGNLNSKNTIQLDYWYPGYSQKQRTGQIFLCCFSLILPLGSEKAHDIQTSELQLGWGGTYHIPVFSFLRGKDDWEQNDSKIMVRIAGIFQCDGHIRGPMI